MLADDPEFAAFWSAYPRKIAKGDARKAWAQTKKIRPAVAEILTALACACGCEQWKKDGGQFIPYAGTWLRQERWADCHDIATVPINDGKIVCRKCARRVSGHSNYVCDACTRASWLTKP